MVCIALCSHANNENTCFPSYETLANEIGCSRRKIISCTKELIGLGLIKVTHNKTNSGRNTSNHYKILTAADESSAPDGEYNAPADSASHTPDSESGTPELYEYNNINSLNNNQSIIENVLKSAGLENFYIDGDRQLYQTVLEKMAFAKSIVVDSQIIPQAKIHKELNKLDYAVMVSVHESTKNKPISHKIKYFTTAIYNELLLTPCSKPEQGVTFLGSYDEYVT